MKLSIHTPTIALLLVVLGCLSVQAIIYKYDYFQSELQLKQESIQKKAAQAARLRDLLKQANSRKNELQATTLEILRSLPSCSGVALDNKSFNQNIPYFVSVQPDPHTFNLEGSFPATLRFFSILNPNPAFQVEGAKLVVNAKREKRLEKHNFFAITGTNCTVEFSLYMGFFDPEKRSDPSIEENYTLKNISGGRDDQNCPLELPYGSDFQQIDGKGLLVITDCVNNHVCLFDDAGRFKSKIFNNGRGEDLSYLSTPADIKIEPKSQSLFIVEELNHRMQVSTLDGQGIKTLGGFGEGPTKFNNPLGISINHQGEIWIADYRNSRIKKFSKNMTPIKTIGDRGCAPGAFTGPYYLESSDGLLFVNDRGNHRIQIFYEDGRWAGSFGGDENCESSSELGRLDNPHEFAVTGSFIYVTDSGNSRIQIFDRTSLELVTTLDDDLIWDFPKTISVSDDGKIYVTNNGEDVLLLTWEPRKADRENFDDLTEKTNFWKTDEFFDLSKNSGMQAVVEKKTNDESFFFMTSGGKSSIDIFDDELNHLRSIKIKLPGVKDATKASKSTTIADLIILKNDYMIGTAYSDHSLLLLTPTGNVLEKTGEFGEAPGQFKFPIGIAQSTNNGLIYVADHKNGRIQVFDENLNFKFLFGHRNK